MIKPRVLELFAGGGGAHLGILAAGCETVACVERDPIACETLRANGAPVLEADVHAFARDCLEHAGEYRAMIDGMWASPPCQPYTRNGKKLGDTDVRDCWPATRDIVAAIRPAFVVIENVVGCPADEWAQQLRELGYPNVQAWKLNAADYGVPQMRARVFVIASIASLSEPKQLPRLGVSDVLPHLKDCWIRSRQVVPGNQGRPPFRASEPCRTILTTDYLSVFSQDPGRFHWGMSRSADAYGGRSFTASELAVIMGFPVQWKFSGNKSQQVKQIGNAVPPALACAVVSAVLNSR